MKRSTVLNLSLIFYFQVTISTVLGQTNCPALEEEPWSYTGQSNGPDKWAKTYKMCGGDMQSPIDIDPDDKGAVTYDKNLKKLKLNGYEKAITKATIENNGHTVMVVPRDKISRYIEIEGKKYSLRQFHFHWSEDTNNGSEHAILWNMRFAMESHFVHMSEDDKIAVVGVIYEVERQNDAFDPIVGILSKIRYKNQRTTYQGKMDLTGFFPANPASFYRYQGSLTTPPCTEGVIWNVLGAGRPVGQDQLNAFLEQFAVPQRESDPGCKITTNVRPLQKLNGRKITESQ